MEDFGRMAAAGSPECQVWRFGPFAVNAAASEVLRDGVAIPIEPQSLRLLIYLLQNRDRVVTREDLIGDLWQGRAVSDWAISGAVKALRGALGDTGRDKAYVRTVHSRGFRFMAEVREDGPPPRDALTVLVRRIRTPSEMPEDTYLSEGMTDDLITDLARQPGLSVLGAHVTRALGDGRVPQDLGVSAVVEGNLRRIGGTIRVNVAVLDSASGRQLWAERFDLTPDSLLAGQDRISARVADVLAPGPKPDAPRPGGTRSAAAYDHYLKGRYAYFRYDPPSFAQALGHFQQSTEIDPGFADAYAQQAYCRTTLFVFALPGGDDTLDPAEDLARRAIALDDGSALGHARLGWVLGYRGRPQDCVVAFEAAMARSGGNAEVCLAYGETMNRLADPLRAEPLLDRAFAQDAFHPPSWEFARGHTEILRGTHARAIGHFRAVIDRVDRFLPARVQLARALWEDGQHDAARDMVTAIHDIAPRYGLKQAERMFPYPVAQERQRLLSALKAAGLS